MFGSRGDRVRAQTPREVNERIDRETAERVRHYATRPESFVSHRIAELDSEWNVDDVLKANVAGLGLLGAALFAVLPKRWLAIPVLAAALVAGNSAEATAPLLVALRQMGIRTDEEIGLEKTALRALRGDFGPFAADATEPIDRADAALRLARERMSRA